MPNASIRNVRQTDFSAKSNLTVSFVAIDKDAERPYIARIHRICRTAWCIPRTEAIIRVSPSAVLQFRLRITKLRMRVVSDRPRFGSRVRIACETGRSCVTFVYPCGLRSLMRARMRSQDKRPLCKREFRSARPIVDAVPVASVLSRLRASVPRRDSSCLRESTRYIPRAECAGCTERSGEGPGVNDGGRL